MRSREILLKLSEGRVQSKYLKANNTLKCEIVTNKIFWESKEVISCLNPIWNDSKNFPISVNSLTLQLFQLDTKSNQTFLGSAKIFISELLNNRKNWWDVKAGNTSVALIFLEVFLYTSPPTSPLRHTSASPSFQITPETPCRFIDSPGPVQEEYLNDYLEKLKLEYSKLNSEKTLLETLQKTLKSKESKLSQEKSSLNSLSLQNQQDLQKIQTQRSTLSHDYTSLKHSKYLLRTQKLLLTKKLEKLRLSEKHLNTQKLLITTLNTDFKKSIIPHPQINLSESVKPVVHDPDTPPDSPIFTQDSTDQTVGTIT